jgi:ketosteroid isomerase-like protein
VSVSRASAHSRACQRGAAVLNRHGCWSSASSSSESASASGGYWAGDVAGEPGDGGLVYERFNSGDIDGLLQLCATGYEFHDLPALPGAGVHIGHDAIRAWEVQMRQTFEDLRFEPEEIIDAGGDRVVVVCRVVGRGKVSGAKLDMFTFLPYNVFTVSQGALVSCITYDNYAEALEAAGLRE